MNPLLPTVAPAAGPIPARAGIGLRAVHHQAILDERPAVGWLEAHSENYFADGGAQIDTLERIRSSYPVSLHGVGLSLGSVDPLNEQHLCKLARLVAWSEPRFVSEHLSWSSVDGTFLNDLLPLPYTEEALRHLVDRVGELQDRLRRQILIENISSYLRFNIEQMQEWEFLSALAKTSGCGLLIDVNNVYVSACNHGFNAYDYLRGIPAQHVQEMHLAGHSANWHDGRKILVDTHSASVGAAVWTLFEFALSCYGPRPTLIEWDAQIPALNLLVDEADKANHYLEQAHAVAA